MNSLHDLFNANNKFYNHEDKTWISFLLNENLYEMILIQFVENRTDRWSTLKTYCKFIIVHCTYMISKRF